MTAKTTALLLFLLFASTSVWAQGWKARSYSVGYRIFETDAVGNNPYTIAPQLKEPAPYTSYLQSIKFNSLFGSPGILNLHTCYIQAEWAKDKPFSRFWKKYTLQTGLLLTGRITQDIGAIGYESQWASADTAIYADMYSLTRQQQFLGAALGINRRFTLSKKLQFLTGLHTQGSVAFVHHYEQRWDSSTYTPSSGWKSRITRMADLEGTNYFQWQVMIPLGLEYAVYKNRFFIRVEADAGILGNRYKGKTFASRETHGAGLFFIYKP